MITYLERARIARAAKARAMSEWRDTGDADASVQRFIDSHRCDLLQSDEGAMGIATEINKSEPGPRILSNCLEPAA